MKKFVFDYDGKDDVLYIANAGRDVEESIEISEDIVLDLDMEGKIVGVEIFYASELFKLFDGRMDKEFLKNLKEVDLQYKESRDMWLLVIGLQSGHQRIIQPLPFLKKSKYIGPLVTS